MAKRALTTLITDVGFYLEITPSASTDPTSTEITKWLNEAQHAIVRSLPGEALSSLLITADVAAVSVSYVNEPTGFQFLESASVANDGLTFYPARIVKPEFGAYAVTNTLLQDTQNPIVWQQYGRIYWSPATGASGQIRLVYISIPTELTGSGTTELPECCEDALVYFAVASARLQDEELTEYDKFMEKYNNELKAIAARYGYGGAA